MRRSLLLATITAGTITGLILLATLLAAAPATMAAGQASLPDNQLPAAPETIGDWDGDLVTLPAVVSDSQQYLMWYDGRGPSGNAIGMATGSDAVTWSKYGSNPVLSPGPEGEWDAFFRGGQMAVITDSGIFEMWFTGGDGDLWQAGYATSTNGTDWNVYGGNPVLAAGGGGEWDEQDASSPTVIKDGSTYKLWYHGCDAGYASCSIGYATSSDGVNWTKYPANPVLSGTGGEWDEGIVFWPRVIKNGSTYQMWYHHEAGIGYATSGDGTTWIKHGSNPVITESWDGGPAHAGTILLDGATYRMWLAGGMGPSQGIGYAESTDGVAWTMHPGNPVLGPGTPSLILEVNLDHDWTAANTRSHTPVTVTVSGPGGPKATVTGMTDENGLFQSDWEPWTPEHPNIEPGDVVTATTAEQMTVVDPVGTIEARVDADADDVAGTIHAPWFAPTMLDVRCEVWVDEPPPAIEVTADADGGAFTCDFSTVGWDLQPGEDVGVFYHEPDGDKVVRVFSSPWMRVNYAHDWIGANYPAGHTFWLTVTDSADVVKATGVFNTTPNGGWSTDGFETTWEGWTPENPDIEPGDWVYARSDDGYVNTVHVGLITGALDITEDAVGGNVYADWFTETLDVACHPWGAPGPVPDKQSSAAPDGTIPYHCDWDAATEWDILPGQDVAVMYVEPDADRIIDVYQEPAPYLLIDKRVSGSPDPGEGGHLVFEVEYWNDGAAPAEEVVITDTMEGFSYLYDTNPYATMTETIPGGERVVWDLGTVAENTYGHFEVFVRVTEPASSTVTNSVQIATGNPYDQGDPAEKESTWVGHVQENDTHLNVDKGAWTGDPAADTDVVFGIFVCNDGTTGSSEVVVTDTLHPLLTFQDWWAQHAGWTEVSSSANRVVLSRPSLPGHWCSEVYVRAHVDPLAQPGDYITNTAVVTASNDLEGDDNEAFWEGWIGEPRVNLSMDKTWNSGQLVPGGRIIYHLHYENNGNMPVESSFYITDTLPAGTTFDGAWSYDEGGPQPVTPTLVSDEIVVWEVSGLPNGHSSDFDVELIVDPSAAPGAILTNTATISRLPGEDGYDDNESLWVETLYDHGANLRVRKYGWWHDWGPDTRLAQYDVAIENVGTVALEHPMVTDTLPAGMELDGDPWVDWWRWWEWGYDGGSGVLTTTLEILYPGETAWLHFNAIVPGNGPLPFGLIFTNTAEVTLDPADVNPDDNEDETVLTTGPDLFVDKQLLGGDLRPGGLVTFTITFGNDRPGHEWWWGLQNDAWLTDTLPAGMTYVTSTLHWCGPEGEWCAMSPEIEDGTTLAWRLWPLEAGAWNEIRLTAQLADTVEDGDHFANQVEILSSDPAADAEPYDDNNESSAGMTLTLPRFAVSKAYESSRVAGTTVTYTVTVDNEGSAIGTGVQLGDTLPAGLTFGGSDGSFDGTAVFWTFSEIPTAGNRSGWFTATLSCSVGSVRNDDYGVFQSDQRIVSEAGTPVSFGAMAPTLVAIADISPVSAEPGTAVSFVDASTTNGTPIVEWEWDFGDGSDPVHTRNASHAYATEGVYTVQLTVTDACGFTESTTVQVEIAETEYPTYLPIIAKP